MKVNESCRKLVELLIILRRSTGHPRFFLGSDSAPHPLPSKSTSSPGHGCAAGVYTSPILLPLTAHLLESFGALDKLEGFVSTFGRKFYGREVPETREGTVTLRKIAGGKKVSDVWRMGEECVVSFMAGKHIGWEIDVSS